MSAILSGAKPAEPNSAQPLYHFTDTARLPWIIASGELRAGRNRIGDFPDPDFLWATTDSRGDMTASAHRGEAYQSGKVRHVRFTLATADFMPWSDVPAAFPQWTADHVGRLEAVARGKSSPSFWWCRADAIPLGAVLQIDTRSWRDNRWRPFDLASDVAMMQGDEPGLWLGLAIEGTVFASCKGTGPHGQDAYQIRSAPDRHFNAGRTPPSSSPVRGIAELR